MSRRIPKVQVREADVLTASRQLLDLLQTAGHLFYLRLHVMPIMRGSPMGSIFSKNKDMQGAPDLLVFLKAGPALFLECKSPTGQLTDSQKAFKAKVERIGGIYRVIRNVEELTEILATYGVRHWAFPPREGQLGAGTSRPLAPNRRRKPMAIEGFIERVPQTIEGGPLLPGRVGKLDTECSIRKEMGRLYRHTLQGKLPPDVYTKLIYGLTQMAKIIQGSDLKGREVASASLEELVAGSVK